MILLKNGTFIDWQNLEFSSNDLLVEEGVGGKINFNSASTTSLTNAKTIDCSGKFITKSFGNGHHHAYSALSRGMPPPLKPTKNFHEKLQNVWWKLDKAHDPDSIRYSALLTAIDCIRNGVTFVIDHHASPFAAKGSLEIIAQAFEEVGVSHLLCYEISERDGAAIAENGLVETAEYLSKRQGLVGLHASFTVGDGTMKRAVQLAKEVNSGIHIHTAEDLCDQYSCLQDYHTRVIERLADNGVLQFPKTILAHCLHLNEHERGLVEGSPAWVVQNMESNLSNRVGYFSSKELGNNIMYGTDGMHSDVLRSAKTAYFSGQGHDEINLTEAYRRFRNVHSYINQNQFCGDGENNLIVLDYNPPTPFNQTNYFGHLFYGINSASVCSVISNGKLVMEDRRILTVNEEDVYSEARKQAEALWKRIDNYATPTGLNKW